jgi:hypothetical protein
VSRRSHRSSSKSLASLLVALALVAAACGDDGDSVEADASTTTSPATTEAPPDDAETTTTTEAAPEVVLTDSFRGVTSESIKIGVPYVDTTAIGLEPSHEAPIIWQVAADTINADGGVLGRNVELVVVSVDPTDSTARDTACVQLTEDEQVFAVMGVLLREQALCYTESNDTIGINSYETDQEIYDRSLAPIIGVLPLAERATDAQLETLIESGRLDGEKVALSATPTTLELADTMKQILEEAGIEVVAVTNFESPNSDLLALDAEMDVSVERWRTAGATAVVAVPGASVPTTGALSRNLWDGLYVITDASGVDLGLLDIGGYSADALVGAIAVVPPEPADLYESDQAGVKECVDTFEAAFDDDAPVEIRPEDSSTDVLGVIVRACQALELFKVVAEAAGPDLTNDSFAMGADSLGEFTVTGVLAGSLGEGKRDYVDAGSAIYEFDEELQRFVIA